MKSNKNIVLIGMMGSGKSSIGKILSKKLNLTFIDIDQKIEESEDSKISEIFTKYGEKYFRKIEEKISLKFLRSENSVISLGGGGFINASIRKMCKQNCLSFWLDWKDDTIIKRIFRNDKRPLARRSSKLDLKDMIIQRHKHYKQANHRIICENLNKKQIADEIIKKYEIQ